MNSSPNQLINEKSPYLLQHAYNPVHWYAWNEKTFTLAKKEDKPVFLSIGYSTCHWCHVMAHESFEDEELAAILNENFISIKVDREERPDIDSIYMNICQLMTGSGGWPLTIIMTPDKRPFYATTYLPKDSKPGRIGLMELLPKIIKLWENNRKKTLSAAKEIINALQKIEDKTSKKTIDEKILKKAYFELENNYDEVYGGFGRAPKFPIPHQMLFLLHYWHKNKEEKALQMVKQTLKAMRAGGIYDQIAYGFHRYSTDQKWLVPHFEKMLYDQALLLFVYLEAYQATGKEIYSKTAEEIISYLKREMLSPEGGFYSAEDADSEGIEGKFYVWTLDEIKKHFSESDSKKIINYYNLKKEGNFREESTGRKSGQNILFLKNNLEENNTFPGDYDIESLRKKLFEIREKRIHPHKDDKILTDWNGLVIAALAQAGWVLDNDEYIKLAENTSNFILSNLKNKNAELLHRYRDGEAAILANLNDYSFLIHGLIELYQATLDSYYLSKALALNNYLLENFWNNKSAGFFFTSKKAEKLLTREIKVYDGALPSGNSIAMGNLIKLSHITGQIELEKMADYLKKYKSIDNKATVYVCQNYTCKLPTTDINKMLELIKN